MKVAGPVLSSALAPWYMVEAPAVSGVLGRGSFLEGGKRRSPQNSPIRWSSKCSLETLYIPKHYEYFRKPD